MSNPITYYENLFREYSGLKIKERRLTFAKFGEPHNLSQSGASAYVKRGCLSFFARYYHFIGVEKLTHKKTLERLCTTESEYNDMYIIAQKYINFSEAQYAKK